MLLPGQPAPWFRAAALSGNPNYVFDTAAGRWIAMLFLGREPALAATGALQALARHRGLFDDQRASFFGVTIDPAYAAAGTIAQSLPGVRWFLDYDQRVSTLFDAIDANARPETCTPHWLLLDPMLRVRERAPLSGGDAILTKLSSILAAEAEVATAPVLVVPGVFSRDLCRDLIELYDQEGGEESGFMCDIDGVTTKVNNHALKRRSDYVIEDGQLIASLRDRLSTALVPMIERAFQFTVTRIERSIVACYDADEGGHFRAHRDNTTAGTAHRKFACTINLNAEDYVGGDLCFPEFGPRTYRAPTGGAVIFSCSLLHEARPVTSGRRYAYLPFFYDEAGARLRERNLAYVSQDLKYYKSGLPAEAANGDGAAGTPAMQVVGGR